MFNLNDIDLSEDGKILFNLLEKMFADYILVAKDINNETHTYTGIGTDGEKLDNSERIKVMVGEIEIVKYNLLKVVSDMNKDINDEC